MGRVARSAACTALLAFALQAGASRANIDGPIDAAARALLASGEASLARGAVASAQSDFEQAAANRHDAEIEVCLVRTSMQAGQYRSAMALAAHSAGIHRDYPDAAALQAWLLFAGGQRDVAVRVLDSALEASPEQPSLQAVRAMLAEPWPSPDAQLLDPPLRLAPYSVPMIGESILISGATLIDGGRRALAPLADGGDESLRPGARVWVRNGTGDAAAATIERPVQVGNFRLVVLALEAPLPWPGDLAIAARRPFAGSPGYSVQYVPTAGPALPAWPLLSVGFFGRPTIEDSLPSLGIPTPNGALGGPVFDSAGGLAGIAVGTAAAARFLPLDTLSRDLRLQFPGPPEVGAAPRRPLDTIYEVSLRLSLQILLERPEAAGGRTDDVTR